MTSDLGCSQFGGMPNGVTVTSAPTTGSFDGPVIRPVTVAPGGTAILMPFTSGRPLTTFTDPAANWSTVKPLGR